ncbi:hypothetical protein WJX84_007105 [Apatococcus fuscideae]|uniref:Uncharacterized protein n=1 Tax=Apatococcus fuscideae TaxID=2026836 RepID=A0AAW1SWQ4_9CHLO
MAGEWSFPEREREVAAAGETGVALADMIGEDTAEGPPPPAESSDVMNAERLVIWLLTAGRLVEGRLGGLMTGATDIAEIAVEVQ